MEHWCRGGCTPNVCPKCEQDVCGSAIAHWCGKRPVQRWDRVEPEQPCTSPDGHLSVDVKQFGVDVPVRVMCVNCGRDYQVVVLA